MHYFGTGSYPSPATMGHLNAVSCYDIGNWHIVSLYELLSVFSEDDIWKWNKNKSKVCWLMEQYENIKKCALC